MRVLGLDLGSVRIGVAVSDTARTVATPIEVVRRSGDVTVDHRAIAAIAEEWEVGLVVVGLPLSLDGSVGPAAQGVLAEIPALAAALELPVETYDERLTTVAAHHQLRAAGTRGRARRQVVDMVAAAVLLQSWLDSNGRTPENP